MIFTYSLSRFYKSHVVQEVWKSTVFGTQGLLFHFHILFAWSSYVGLHMDYASQFSNMRIFGEDSWFEGGLWSDTTTR